MIQWLKGYFVLSTYVRFISWQSWHTNHGTPCSLGYKFHFLSHKNFRFAKLGRVAGPANGPLETRICDFLTHLLSSMKGPSLQVLTLIWKISESLCCHPPDATISIPRSTSGDITWQVCPKRSDSMSGSTSQVFGKEERARAKTCIPLLDRDNAAASGMRVILGGQ